MPVCIAFAQASAEQGRQTFLIKVGYPGFIVPFFLKHYCMRNLLLAGFILCSYFASAQLTAIKCGKLIDGKNDQPLLLVKYAYNNI